MILNILKFILFFTTIIIHYPGYSYNNYISTLSSLIKEQHNNTIPKILWQCSVGKGINKYYSKLHLAYQNNVIFAADRYGVVKALNCSNGKEIWSTNLSIPTNFLTSNYPALLSGGISVSGNYIYIGSELAKVYSLNASNGKILWQTSISGEVLSSPIIDGNLILIRTANAMLYALDKNNGSIKWTNYLHTPPLLSLRIKSSPSVAFGTVVIGDDNGIISVFLTNNGQTVWQRKINRLNDKKTNIDFYGIYASPIIVNNVVYVSIYGDSLTALDLYSGQIKWSKKINLINDPIIKNNIIYLSNQSNQIIALNKQNGNNLWQQNMFMKHNLTSLVFYKKYIVISDLQGYIQFIDSNNGNFIISKKIDSTGLLSKLLVVEDKLIIQAKNGKIYAVTI